MALLFRSLTEMQHIITKSFAYVWMWCPIRGEWVPKPEHGIPNWNSVLTLRMRHEDHSFFISRPFWLLSPGDSPTYFGLGSGPITPPGPEMVLMDRKDLN